MMTRSGTEAFLLAACLIVVCLLNLANSPRHSFAVCRGRIEANLLNGTPSRQICCSCHGREGRWQMCRVWDAELTGDIQADVVGVDDRCHDSSGRLQVQ